MDEGHGGTLIRQKKFWFGEKIFARSTEAQKDVCNLRVQIDRGLSLEKHFSSSSSTLHICLFCFHNKAIFSISSVFKSHSNGRRKNKLWRILSILELSIKVGSDAICRGDERRYENVWKRLQGFAILITIPRSGIFKHAEVLLAMLAFTKIDQLVCRFCLGRWIIFVLKFCKTGRLVKFW